MKSIASSATFEKWLALVGYSVPWMILMQCCSFR
jgi:hypothetical protein